MAEPAPATNTAASSKKVFGVKKRKLIRVLFAAQCIHLALLILCYTVFYIRLSNLKCDYSTKSMTVEKREDPTRQDDGRYRRQANSDSPMVDELSQWTVLIGHDTIIPKNVFEKSCRRVHGYCAERGKKLRGFQGEPGPPGRTGPVGPPGRRGYQGRVGPMGLVGDVGQEGPRGRDGKCNCTFPDLYVQRIAVPGPPIIKIEERVVPVPVVVVSEVEVTKLVPFEPTPPGFGPPPGWLPGMPMPDLSQTQLFPRSTTPSTPMTSPTKHPRRRTTALGPMPPPRKGDDEIERVLLDSNGTLLNETFANMTDWVTTPEPYTGPPTLGTNRRECRLNAVGIPVLHAESQYGEVGAWFRDSSPYNEDMSRKRWVTDGYASPVLYEYADERNLLNKKQKIKYYVDYLASGTGSVIHNGSYFYHRHGSNVLVRYDLETTEQIQSDEIGEIASVDCARRHDHTFESCNETERDAWLYDRPHNYVDYSVDENGLWLIYMRPDSTHLTVSKLETNFHVVDTWELNVNGTELADAFVMCGVLYGLESATERDTYISYAFDLYRNESFEVDVPWYNPYRGLTMLHYNPMDGRLYFFDNRKLLSVNVRMEAEIDDPSNGP